MRGPCGAPWSSQASPGHRRFRQVDDDVHLDVPLTLREALLGAEAESHVLARFRAKDVKEGSATRSKVLRLKCQGFKAYGIVL